MPPGQFPTKGAESKEQRLRRGAKIVAARMALIAVELHHTYQFGSRCPDPELVLANEPHAVGAVLSYRFDAKNGEHILRLLHPEAHLKRARAQRSGG
jgi:hypothetical protein